MAAVSNADDIWHASNDNVPLSIDLHEGLNPVVWPFHGHEVCWLPKGTKLRVIEKKTRHFDRPKLIVELVEGRHGNCVPGKPYFANQDELIPARLWERTQVNTRIQQATQQIITGGRWGDEVPVFTSRGMYYSARSSMDREGNYQRQSGSVACKLKVGTKVEFKPFRNWGTGEVRSGNCRGWTDREVIR